MEVTIAEQNIEKRKKRIEDSLRDLGDNIKHTNILIMGVPEEEEKEKGTEKVLEKIIVENFPNMGKEEMQSPIQNKTKEKHTETHSNQIGKN